MTIYCQLEGLMLNAGVVSTTAGLPEGSMLIAPMYCQSATRELTFLLLLSPRWLSEEGLGVHTYKLSKSGTNVELDVSVPLVGCSNWKNVYRHFICGIFGVGIAVHCHCHCKSNHSSAGLPSPRDNRYHPRIGAAGGHFHCSESHGYWRRSFDHCGCFCGHSGTCHWRFDHCSHCCLGLSGTLAGAAVRSGSVCHCVRCMFCRFVVGVSALHVHGIHGSSPFIISCISICHHLNISLPE
jgi:hypothetical protein